MYQTFDKTELYYTIEEKASHLLYLTIKDHPFIDENKRIASFLFIYFLEKNNYLFKNNSERKITDTTLVALALLTAISKLEEKNIMIGIITNVLKD
ncbi:MAG: type II toxin-antitoxin system death-on-curing family toxin [Desulfurella sp.]